MAGRYVLTNDVNEANRLATSGALRMGFAMTPEPQGGATPLWVFDTEPPSPGRVEPPELAPLSGSAHFQHNNERNAWVGMRLPTPGDSQLDSYLEVHLVRESIDTEWSLRGARWNGKDMHVGPQPPRENLHHFEQMVKSLRARRKVAKFNEVRLIDALLTYHQLEPVV